MRGGVFSYTAPVYSVALEPSLLHALTLTGLETYTLRPHPVVVVSHLPEGLNMVVSTAEGWAVDVKQKILNHNTDEEFCTKCNV